MSNIVFGTYNDILFNEKSLMPQPLKNFIPDWYKNITFEEDNNSNFNYIKYLKNVKSCPSFIDIFKFGYVIPAPVDYLIKVNSDNTYEWNTPMVFETEHGLPAIQDHNDLQLIKHLPNNEFKMVLKINLPLKVFTPKGYSCYQLPTPYTYNEYWESAFGMLRTDKLHPVNIQILIKNYGEFIIKQGTPLAVYLPYKRDNLKLKYVNLKENKKFRILDRSKYLKQYGTFKNGIKNYYED